MRSLAVIVAVLAGCGDDGGGGDDGTVVGTSFTTSALTIPATGNGNLVTLAYGGPLASVDDDHVVAAGVVAFDVSVSQRQDSRTLTMLDAGVVKLVEKYTYANTVDVRPSSIVTDGSSGAYIGATRLQTGQTYVSEPVISHFDASGQVTWSKKYSISGGWTLPQLNGIFGASTFPDVTISHVFAGKLAVLAGNAVMVIDADGAVQWAQQFAGQTALTQVLADADGFTIYGNRYEAFLVLRYDWAGTLVFAKQASSNVHGDVRLSPPHRRADGNVALGFDTYDTLNQPVSAAVVFDATGELVESFGYQVAAAWDVNNFDRGLTKPMHIRFIGDDLVTSHHTYQVGTIAPYRDVDVDLVYKVTAAGDVAMPVAFSAQESGSWFRVGSGSVLALANLITGYGSLGAKCSLDAITVTTLTKIAAPVTIQPTTDGAMSPTNLTVTTGDEPVMVTAAGAVTTSPVDSETCR